MSCCSFAEILTQKNWLFSPPDSFCYVKTKRINIFLWTLQVSTDKIHIIVLNSYWFLDPSSLRYAGRLKIIFFNCPSSSQFLAKHHEKYPELSRIVTLSRKCPEEGTFMPSSLRYINILVAGSIFSISRVITSYHVSLICNTVSNHQIPYSPSSLRYENPSSSRYWWPNCQF